MQVEQNLINERFQSTGKIAVLGESSEWHYHWARGNVSARSLRYVVVLISPHIVLSRCIAMNGAGDNV